MGGVRAVAIVNGNARRVQGGVRADLERALPGGVRLTTSLDHARAVIHAEVRRGLDLIVLGGGDGTFVMGLALVAEACRGAGRPEPAIGVLRLGSGNALADALGASGDPAGDLARLVRGEGAWRQVPLVEALGVRAPFVGLGVDAQLVEDHHAVGRVIDRVPGARQLVGGAARYALSVALRSLPRFARGARAHAVVTNRGAGDPGGAGPGLTQSCKGNRVAPGPIRGRARPSRGHAGARAWLPPPAATIAGRRDCESPASARREGCRSLRRNASAGLRGHRARPPGEFLVAGSSPLPRARDGGTGTPRRARARARGEFRRAPATRPTRSRTASPRDPALRTSPGGLGRSDGSPPWARLHRVHGFGV